MGIQAHIFKLNDDQLVQLIDKYRADHNIDDTHAFGWGYALHNLPVLHNDSSVISFAPQDRNSRDLYAPGLPSGNLISYGGVSNIIRPNDEASIQLGECLIIAALHRLKERGITGSGRIDLDYLGFYSGDNQIFTPKGDTPY